MNQKNSSLFELYEQCSESTFQVIFCDLKSKYLLKNAELHESINVIAETLTSASVQNSVVVCLFEPHVLLPAIILGILKTSSAFAFLDIHDPISSLKNLQKYSSVSTLLVDDMLYKNLKELCSCWKKKISTLVNNFSFTILQSLNCSNKLCPSSNLSQQKIPLPASKLAYIMQTSGSTGEPKIVQVPHQCILPNIIDLKSRFKIEPQDVILLCSPLTFDPSIIDIFLSIASGCTLVIVSDLIKSIPRKLSEIIIHNKITVLQATPSLIISLGDDFIQNYLLNKQSILKILAFGGEVCPSRIKLLKWVSEGNETHLFNLYGLTEVSCWAMCYKINLKENIAVSVIPLGEPLMDTTLKINKEGELHIGGKHRWCIINDEQCPKNENDLLRPTGDIVHKTSNGIIYFERRKDDVIKYKGKKLHLQSIKNNLDHDMDISNYALYYDHYSLRIFLFIVWNENVSDAFLNQKRSIILTKLRETVLNLPIVELITVPHIPLTLHGKIDYRKLLKFKGGKIEKQDFVMAPVQNCFGIISEMWKEYTHQNNVDEVANFVISGGDSISALQMSSDIEWKFGILAPDLVETLLNQTFNDVIKLVVTYLQNKNVSHINCNDLMSLQEESFEPPLKKKCLENVEISLCYEMISRQGIILRCTHLDGHSTMQKQKINLKEDSSFTLNMKFKFDLKKCIDASPCVVQFIVLRQTLAFIGSHAGIFCCIDMIAGKIRWEVSLPNRIESSSCLSSCGNFAFVGCYDHHLYCFDVKDGSIIWKFKTKAEVKCSPVVSKQNIIFVGSHDKVLYAIKNTGESLWKKKLSKGSIFSSPTLCEELQALCVATLDGIVAFLKMDSGSYIWMYDYSKPLFSSPRIISKSIYIGSTDNYMLQFDLTGNLLSKFKTNGPIFSSACHIVTTNSITFGCHDCNIYCLNEKMDLLWMFTSDSPVYATPFSFIWGEECYVVAASTSGMLYILQQNNGKLISSHKCIGEIFSSPIVLDNLLIVGCRDNYLYIWKLEIV